MMAASASGTKMQRSWLSLFPLQLVLALTLLSSGCGLWDGFNTAHTIGRIYDQYEADIQSLSRIEHSGMTPAIREAAGSYRLALLARSAALVVDSAIDFDARHGADGKRKRPELESLLTNQELARSKLLLAINSGSGRERVASLHCLHDYGLCAEERDDSFFACNSRLLNCLAEVVSESAAPDSNSL